MDGNMNQIELEKRFICTLVDFPARAAQTPVTPEQLTQPLFQNILAWMQENPAGPEGWDLENAIQNMGTAEFDAFAALMGGALSGSLADHYGNQLMERWKNAMMVRAYQNMETGSIDAGELPELIAQIVAAGRSEEPERTDEEILEMACKVTQCLRFRTLESFRERLPLGVGRTHVLAGYTSRGKSALAMNMAIDLAPNHKVLYFNLEMQEQDVWQRFIGSTTGINTRQLSSAYNSPEGYQTMLQAVHNIRKTGMQIYTGSKTIEQIRSIILKESAGCIPVVIIDHIQYIRTSQKGMDERQQLSHIMKELNGLAKDNKCTPILLSQINRSGSDEATLNNLQGSAAIAQDPDTVMILEYAKGEDPDSLHSEMVLKVQKGRNFGTGKLAFIFHKPTQAFEDITERKKREELQQ